MDKQQIKDTKVKTLQNITYLSFLGVGGITKL
jgi:hypothetical protein